MDTGYLNALFFKKSELVVKDVYFDDKLNYIYVLNKKLGIHMVKWDQSINQFTYDEKMLIEVEQGNKFSYYINPKKNVASLMVISELGQKDHQVIEYSLNIQRLEWF